MVCRDLLTASIPSLPVLNPTDILNAAFVDPTDAPISGFSILLYVGTTAYNFTKFYNPPSMEIEDVRGFERGSCRFRIADWSLDSFNLPFVPVIDQRVEIWNQNQTDLFFAGYIESVENKLISRRDDGTEALFFDITCKDLKEGFERMLISERYEDVPTGFIVKDVITRYTFFDATNIDPTVGREVNDFRVSQETPAQVIQRCLDIEGSWTFWLDPDTRMCYYGENVDVLNAVPITVTESNVYELFDAPSFTLAPERVGVRNVVKFFYDGKYDEGLCSVLKGSKIVFGQDTNWTENIGPDARIRINGGDSEYTIEKVETDTQLRLSSEYQEEDVVIESGVPYDIIGTKMLIIVTDQSSIITMSSVNNEPGIFPERSQLAGRYEYLVPETSTPLTREEARKIAQAHLAKFSQPLVRGEAVTNNHKLKYANLRAGQTLRFELPISRQIVADVVIQRINWRDTGAHMVRSEWGEIGDVRIDPVMILNLDFQDRIFDIRNQMKRLMADVRRVNDSSTVIMDDITVGENIFVDDCVELVPPLTTDGAEMHDEITLLNTMQTLDPYQVLEAITVEDDLSLSDPPTGDFYTHDTVLQAGYCVGGNGFGAAS